MTSFCTADPWRVVWRDEFERPELDPRSWNVEQGVVPLTTLHPGPKKLGADCHGRGCALLGSCREAACRQENVQVRDGRLVLSSQRLQASGRNYTTGAVNSWGKASWRANQALGPFRLCIAAVLPGVPGRAKGVWPAHWLMPQDDACDPDEGEFDIMEMVDGDGVAYATYHWQDGVPMRKCAFPKNHQSVFAQARLADGWNSTLHEWAVEHGEKHVAFALDGRVILNTSSPRFHSVAWYLILNTAIGGAWPGSPTPDTVFPVSHEIEYVRVSRLS